MNFLFLTLSSIKNVNQRGLYNDFIRELAKNDINVYVVCPSEIKYKEGTKLSCYGNIKLLNVYVGNITKTNRYIKKAMATLMLEYKYLKAIKKYFKNVKYDLVIYSTPPITYEKIIRWVKKHNKCKSYLLLKDIFPQNSVDIGLINKKSLVYKYFREKEKKLYILSDYIGCMSQANKEYILSHNKFIREEQVEIFPNSINPISREINNNIDKDYLLKKYGLPKNKVIFIYGGNLGKPQGIDFVLEVIMYFEEVSTSFLLIIGNGTEFNRIKEFIQRLNIKNTKIISYLDKLEFDEVLNIVDVGLIFLDRRFTIPNFPSRLLSYMEYKLPILAATDKNTDLKDVIIKAKCGYWCESGDLESFKKYVSLLNNDLENRLLLGKNSRKYLEENYDIKKNIYKIIKHVQEG